MSMDNRPIVYIIMYMYNMCVIQESMYMYMYNMLSMFVYTSSFWTVLDHV